MFRQVLGIWDKSKLEKMCLHGILRHDIMFHSLQGREAIGSHKKKMPSPKNPHDIQVFNGLTQFYRCFVKNFAFTMATITKIIWKSKEFIWTQKCQDAWETTKQKYVEALILIAPNWERKFYVHKDASNLVVGVMLAQNLDGKCN